MRVAVIADTHLPRGARRLPDECLDRLRSADAVLHAGDFTSVAFFDELRTLGRPLHAVHGNADEPDLKRLLPRELVIELDGRRVGLVHVPGPRIGRERRLLSRLPGCDIVVFGHTHVPEARVHDGVLLVNPGSPTERRRSPARGMAILDLGRNEITPELVRLP